MRRPLSRPWVNIAIEILSPDEWPAYRTLRLEALQNAPHAFGASYAESVAKPNAYWEARLVAAQERNGNWLLFARQDNHLVGMVGAFTSEDIHLADIVYVTPPARGQGIAQRLMAALLDELAQSDTLETARLTVNQDQLPAVALYRRFGFTIIAQEEVLMGDGKLHTEDIMQKPLKR